MTEIIQPSTETAETAVKIYTFLDHMKKPENLLTYMVFTAWTKFMGIASYLPSITIG